MTTTSTESHPLHPGRTISAVLGIVLGSLILLGSVFGTFPMLSAPFQDTWNGNADLLTAQLPFEQDPESPQSNPASTYTGVLVSSDDPLVTPRLLLAAQSLLILLVMYTAGAMLVLLALQLLRQRPFARTLRWGLVALGTLIMLSSAVGPQLGALSSDLGLIELGVPLGDSGSVSSLTADSADTGLLHLWDSISVLSRIELVPLLLGTVLSMIGFLISDGERMQRDTEGLV